MSDLDDLLQRKLQALEEGATVEQSLADLPAEGDNLTPLIRLAAAIRAMAHPEPSPTAAQAGRNALLTAASKKTIWKRTFSRSTGWLAPAFASAALLFTCLFISILSIAAWQLSVKTRTYATLVDFEGVVEVSIPGGKTSPQQAAMNQRLQAGTQIRTREESRASLRFPDGSLTILDARTTVTISRLQRSLGGEIQVALDQELGASYHQVIPFNGKRSSFLVQTPSGVAEVHGTRFLVIVEAGGETFYTAETGKITVSSAGKTVTLLAGQGCSVQEGMAPEQPAFTFALNDKLEAAQSGALRIGGVLIEIAAPGERALALEPGVEVLALGRIQPNGAWVADVILPSGYENEKTYFNGIIDSIRPTEEASSANGQIWTINGRQLLVNEVTELKGNFKPGVAVKVRYIILLSGEWLALEIERLDQDEVLEFTTQVAAKTITEPKATRPSETMPQCKKENQPKAEKLARQYQVAYEEIIGWFCQGFGFGEIDLAYTLSNRNAVPVSEIFALRHAGLGWGEIKLRLRLTATPTLPAAKTPTAAPSATRTPTITLEGDYTPTVTTTPFQTATAAIEQTATAAAAATETGITQSSPTPMTAFCTGADPQPTGWRLAERYAVSYAEIMGWFCQGHGFGEIDLAYRLSRQNETPVENIFALRQSGMGWGEIKQMFGKGKP